MTSTCVIDMALTARASPHHRRRRAGLFATQQTTVEPVLRTVEPLLKGVQQPVAWRHRVLGETISQHGASAEPSRHHAALHKSP